MIKFCKYRKVYFAISLFVLLSCLVFSLVFGIKLDIDFKGGSLVEYSFVGDLNLAEVDKNVSKATGEDITCQITKSLGDSKTKLVISVAGSNALSPEKLGSITDTLQSSYKDANFSLESSNLVDPFIGHALLRKGILALIVASLLIIGYVWFSFRSMSGPSAGVMALLALFHDMLVAFSVFVFMRTPLNETLIAVCLTILGYSINDTIVIYDRIRENIRLTKGTMPLEELVDKSITQSLGRSINTSMATFVAVTIAYIFAAIHGLQSITTFALPMMIGIISGTYSTICLAGPLWVMWKTRGGRSGYEN